VDGLRLSPTPQADAAEGLPFAEFTIETGNLQFRYYGASLPTARGESFYAFRLDGLGRSKLDMVHVFTTVGKPKLCVIQGTDQLEVRDAKGNRHVLGSPPLDMGTVSVRSFAGRSGEKMIPQHFQVSSAGISEDSCTTVDLDGE